MLSTSDKLKSTLLKPLIKAGVSGITTRMVYGDKEVTIFGTPYSMLTFGAGVGAASEGVAQIINMWVLPRLEANNQARHSESLVISLGIAAGSFALVPMLVSSNQPTSSEMLTMAGIGAVTEMASTYIYDNLLGNSGGQGPLISVF
jgi:hypothetical protein